MKLNNLKPAAGSTHSRRRIGRGPGSGLGGTSTRGHKGAKARSGYKRKIGFEGGQMPLQRRVPKAGFKNINHKEYFAVNLSTLQALAKQRTLQRSVLRNLRLLLLPMVRSSLRFSVTVNLKQNWKLKLMLSQRLPKKQSRQ